jgi:hypothetical protein
MEIAWHIAAQVPLCEFHSQPEELKEQFLKALTGFQSDPSSFPEDAIFSIWLEDNFPTLEAYHLLENCHVTEIRDLVVATAEDILAHVKRMQL